MHDVQPHAPSKAYARALEQFAPKHIDGACFNKSRCHLLSSRASRRVEIDRLASSIIVALPHQTVERNYRQHRIGFSGEHRLHCGVYVARSAKWTRALEEYDYIGDIPLAGENCERVRDRRFRTRLVGAELRRPNDYVGAFAPSDGRDLLIVGRNNNPSDARGRSCMVQRMHEKRYAREQPKVLLRNTLRTAACWDDTDDRLPAAH